VDKYTNPNFETSALITIDTQRDTLDGQPFEIPGTSDILPTMSQLLQVYRDAKLPIIHIVRIYRPDGSNVDLCRRGLVEEGAKLVLSNSDGCQLAPLLLADSSIRIDDDLLLSGGIQEIENLECIIYKSRWGAFYKTKLEEHLKALGVDSLVFCGCNFPNCPRTSVYEASERDFKIVMVEDAISGIYNQGKKEMQNIGVKLLKSREVIALVGQ